jgi:hypothetical protein
MTLIRQPYFTRILETLDPNFSGAFGNGHTHTGYFDDPQARDVDAAVFAATDELARRILHVAGIRDGMPSRPRFFREASCDWAGARACLTDHVPDGLR